MLLGLLMDAHYVDVFRNAWRSLRYHETVVRRDGYNVIEYFEFDMFNDLII